LNSHYRLLWLLLLVDSHKDLQVVEDQQKKQPDHMEAGVLGHREDAAGIHQRVSFELLSAGCILLADHVAVVRYSALHRKREGETECIYRHIPEHNNFLLAMEPHPHSLI
jgi:hypothetical protein